MRRFLICLLAIVFYSSVQAQEAPEGLFIGSRAPDFKATDQNSQALRLKDMLKEGKVVLVFYRGYWCPFCNRELSQLQDSLSLITEKGARVVAVSPESPESLKQTAEKTGVTFSLISDAELKIMKAYEVEFELPENTITRYRNSNIDIQKINGKNGAYLPVPAVYIIDKEATVTYRFFNTDYRRRPSVAELLRQL